jgi:diacylglycerol kinase (ATP)
VISGSYFTGVGYLGTLSGKSSNLNWGRLSTDAQRVNHASTGYGRDNCPHCPNGVVAYNRRVPGIGLITNPLSRVNLRDPGRARKLGYLIGSHGQAEATRSLDDLYRVCEQFKDERIDVLGISGGDGTLHHTLTAMIKTYGEQPLPPVAILRGGTMNTIARSFGIFGESQQLTFELVDRHRRGLLYEVPLVEREILQIGDKFGFIFGNGIIYNFLHEYYASGRPSPATATKLIMRAAGSTMIAGPLSQRIYKRFHARVVADGDRWACTDFITVAAAVVEHIGLGFRPFYRVGNGSAGFAVLGIHTDAVGFVAELPNILAGKPMRRDKVIDQLAHEVTFESATKLEYIIDGDTYEQEGTLVLRMGPKLRFLRLPS